MSKYDFEGAGRTLGWVLFIPMVVALVIGGFVTVMLEAYQRGEGPLITSDAQLSALILVIVFMSGILSYVFYKWGMQEKIIFST